MSGWKTTSAPGVRYREHTSRLLPNGRPDRYFAIRYYIGGKRREDGLGWASEGWTVAKAQRLLGQLKEAHKTGDGPTSLAEFARENRQRREDERQISEVMALGEFFDQYYMPAAKRRKRSWNHDKGRFEKGIRPVLGAYPLRGITQEHVQSLLDALRKNGASEATCLQYMAILRQVFNLARVTLIAGSPVYQEQITPIDGVRLPKALVERERFLTYTEADRLIEACADDADLHDLIVLALNTGLRLGELVRLEWSDINLAHGLCSVRHEDMRKPGGRIPLNAVARDVLQRRFSIREKKQRLVFSAEVSGVDGNVLRRRYEALVDLCKFNEHSTGPRDRVVFHTLRHTFASWLAIAGTDIYRIKALMRHKTIKMTERYAHLLPDAMREAVEHIRPPSHGLEVLQAGYPSLAGRKPEQ